MKNIRLYDLSHKTTIAMVVNLHHNKTAINH